MESVTGVRLKLPVKLGHVEVEEEEEEKEEKEGEQR